MLNPPPPSGQYYFFRLSYVGGRWFYWDNSPIIHLSKTCHNSINNVVSTASFLVNCKLPSLNDVFNRVFKNRCIRISAMGNEPVSHLERLPSRHYRYIKGRTALHGPFFSLRAHCVGFWNSVFPVRWAFMSQCNFWLYWTFHFSAGGDRIKDNSNSQWSRGVGFRPSNHRLGLHVQRNELTPPQGLNLYFLCKGTLAAFDNGVKLIVMHRCIVSLKYGTETGKFWFTYGRQPAAAVATHRWNCEQKAPDVEIPCGRDCGTWVLKGPSVPSRCGCDFLTGTAFPLVPAEFKHWIRGQNGFDTASYTTGS